MANTLGKLFTVTSFGESHGRCVGAVVDGCPAGLPLEEGDIQQDLDRRRPGAGPASTARSEADRVEILSGTYEGRTTGAPICMIVWNSDTDSTWYLQNRFLPRPGHADFAARVRYGGFNDPRGGGRFSGRITASFVMAGAIARKLLLLKGIDVLAHTVAIGGVTAAGRGSEPARGVIENDPLRCADPAASARMLAAIEEARTAGDSLGGVIEGMALNVPTGLGEPVFDTLEGDLAKAMFAIPAVKAVEFGSGFSAARKRGSENNDAFAVEGGRVVARSNNAGGILGGISSGMPVVLRVAVKPTPSISLEQETVNLERNEPATLSTRGRHDACIVPRAVPVVEALMAVTLCDFALMAGVIPEVIA
jgi:chorismate synthase